MSSNSEKQALKHKDKLARSLGTPGITALGIGAMIGAGIFVLTGMAAGEAGPALILAFALNAFIALIVGACYAELATMMPRTGGAYVWAKKGLGPLFGFYAGWMSSFAQLIACALYATAFGSFAQTLIHELAGWQLFTFVDEIFALGLLVLLLWINYYGARDAGKLEVLITGLKIAILLGVGLLGLPIIFSSQEGGTAAFIPFFPQGIGGLLSAMGITFIAFEGYEIIVQSVEEVKKPKSAVPRAIFLSILISAALYVLVAVVMLGAVEAPVGEKVYAYLGRLEELGLMEAASQFVPYGKIILLIAGLASTASALNATIYGSTRIAFSMGREGDLPNALGRVHRKRQTPYIALLILGALMLIITIALPIKDIAASTNIMFLLVFVLVCVTLIRLRIQRPKRQRPFKVPFFPWLPAMAIIAGIGLSLWLLQISLIAWSVALTWMILGGITYWHQGSLKNRET